MTWGGVTAATHNALNQITALSPTGPIRFEGTVSEPSTVTVNGGPAYLDGSNAFSADVTLAPGTPTVTVVATDGSGNTATQHYQVTVDSGAARTLAYDANGNLTNDGAGKAYDWDAADRLVKITQGSNVTEFVYNGVGQRVQEKLAGSVIKQWVWCDGPQPSEERDVSNAVTRRFYAAGEQIGSSAYFFTTDHLRTIREMTDATGAIRARYDYDPYGRVTKLSGDLEADSGFTGFYRHQASGLWLTLYRAYDANLGRWLSRDPISEDGGLNLYAYVAGNPINAVDLLGLEDEWSEVERLSSSASGGRKTAAEKAQIISNLNHAIIEGTITAAGVILDASAAQSIVRRGLYPESVSRLAKQAAEAEAEIGVHGVSVTAKPGTIGKAVCMSKARESFNIIKTGKDIYHYTVELTKPVTKEVAKLFNEVFH